MALTLQMQIAQSANRRNYGDYIVTQDVIVCAYGTIPERLVLLDAVAEPRELLRENERRGEQPDGENQAVFCLGPVNPGWQHFAFSPSKEAIF